MLQMSPGRAVLKVGTATLAASASSSAGASCSVNLNGEALSGTCEEGPQGEALACKPARPR